MKLTEEQYKLLNDKFKRSKAQADIFQKKCQFNFEKLLELEDNLKLLVDRTNRSKSQTEFLFELVEYNFETLVEVERKLKNNFLFYCPGDKEEVVKVLSYPK